MSNTQDKQFQQLYEQHHGMVRQLTLGFVKGNQTLANDLIQEVFINVWKALSNFNSKASHRTWIYRITVNTCLKSFRTHKSEALLTDIDEDTLSAPNALAKEESAEHLYNAIGQLEQLDRLVIMMVLDELPYPDIAQVLGVSEGTLRVRIHRAKKQLQEHLSHEH
jgi:RNA polymerase sigma factor (sigma-70 family)